MAHRRRRFRQSLFCLCYNWSSRRWWAWSIRYGLRRRRLHVECGITRLQSLTNPSHFWATSCALGDRPGDRKIAETDAITVNRTFCINCEELNGSTDEVSTALGGFEPSLINIIKHVTSVRLPLHVTCPLDCDRPSIIPHTFQYPS